MFLCVNVYKKDESVIFFKVSFINKMCNLLDV